MGKHDRIAAFRHEEPYIYMCEGGRLQGLEQCLGRQEIRCLDIHSPSCIGNGLMQRLATAP